jgi:hypothetical protein
VRKTAVKADGAAEPVKPRRRRKAVGTPLEPTPVVVEAASVVETAPVVVEAAPVVEIAPVVETAPVVESAPPAVDFWAPRDVEPADELATPPSAAEPPWQPTMPPPAATPPWRRSFSIPVPSSSSPVLVIDDADPDRAEREQEARSPRRSSFLPSILLDRDDRSARQGGLTLAVIILLIAATLTLSYLMRRPSASGDGVTMDETTLDTPAQLA